MIRPFKIGCSRIAGRQIVSDYVNKIYPFYTDSCIPCSLASQTLASQEDINIILFLELAVWQQEHRHVVNLVPATEVGTSFPNIKFSTAISCSFFKIISRSECLKIFHFFGFLSTHTLSLVFICRRQSASSIVGVHWWIKSFVNLK